METVQVTAGALEYREEGDPGGRPVVLLHGLLIPTVVDGYTDLGAAIDGVFTQAARDMADTGFANMCPVASVAGEVADTVEELRSATRDIFTAWIDGGAAYFTSRGLDEPLARQVTTALIAGLEGAFLLARAMRDTAPLLATGATMAPQYRGIALAPRVGVDAR